MTSAVLIPGAGGLGWYWHLVERDLQDRGYDAFAVDLAARGRTGLPAYADAVVDAIDGRTDVVLIAQSMGGFTAPLVWQRVPTRLVVFVNAMIPRPGETPGEWWGNVDSEAARTAAAARYGYAADFDLTTYFMHDVPDALAVELQARAATQLDKRFDDVSHARHLPPRSRSRHGPRRASRRAQPPRRPCRPTRRLPRTGLSQPARPAPSPLQSVPTPPRHRRPARNDRVLR